MGGNIYFVNTGKQTCIIEVLLTFREYRGSIYISKKTIQGGGILDIEGRNYSETLTNKWQYSVLILTHERSRYAISQTIMAFQMTHRHPFNNLKSSQKDIYIINRT